MLQRLAMVMCQSLSTEEAASSIAVTSVSFFSTLLQLHARPYRLSRVNNLQLLALVCLTMISVLDSAQSAFESAGVDSEQSPALAELVHDAELIMFLLLLPPPLLLLYHTVSAVSRGGDGTELVVVEDDKLNERRRHEEERVQLLAENDRALVAKDAEKDAEKEQQLAAKDAEKEQQLADERQRHKEEMQQQLAAKDAEKEQQLADERQRHKEEMQQQLAENEAKIEHLLAEMASSGIQKSSEGAGAADAGATKKGRNQYSTVEQPIQR
jgi:flagellar biosynthesis GTPase FlhF